MSESLRYRLFSFRKLILQGFFYIENMIRMVLNVNARFNLHHLLLTLSLTPLLQLFNLCN